MSPILKEVLVTPEMAIDLLGNNTRNRGLSKRVVDSYARDMREGRWAFVGDPIRVDEDGVLLDGQHRLHAIIEAEVSCWMVLITGLPPESQQHMDTGRRRRVGDQLQIEGYGSAVQRAAVSRLLLMWQAGQLIAGNTVFSNGEVLDYARAHADAIGAAVLVGERVHSSLKGSLAAYGATYFKVVQLDADEADEFYGMLASGANLHGTHPALVLRNSILRRATESRRATVAEMIYYLCKSWNHYRLGKTPTKLYLPKAGLVKMADFPELV